jgi:hypothetical protein
MSTTLSVALFHTIKLGANVHSIFLRTLDKVRIIIKTRTLKSPVCLQNKNYLMTYFVGSSALLFVVGRLRSEYDHPARVRNCASLMRECASLERELGP